MRVLFPFVCLKIYISFYFFPFICLENTFPILITFKLIAYNILKYMSGKEAITSPFILFFKVLPSNTNLIFVNTINSILLVSLARVEFLAY